MKIFGHQLLCYVIHSASHLWFLRSTLPRSNLDMFLVEVIQLHLLILLLILLRIQLFLRRIMRQFNLALVFKSLCPLLGYWGFSLILEEFAFILKKSVTLHKLLSLLVQSDVNFPQSTHRILSYGKWLLVWRHEWLVALVLRRSLPSREGSSELPLRQKPIRPGILGRTQSVLELRFSQQLRRSLVCIH